MATPHVYRTEAVILRQRRLAEADKICVLLTPLHGRIEAVAKGVRRPISRLAGHVDPLTRVNLLLAQGRSLDIITQAETVACYPTLHDEIELLSRGLYAAELADRFTEVGGDTGSLYRQLVATLERIEAGAGPDLAVRWFELHLLADQGYKPEFRACVRCQRSLEAEGNAFSAAAGGVLCPECRSWLPGRPLSARAFKLIRFLESAPYGEAARVRVDAPLAQELEDHLRDAVQTALDQEVRTAGFIETVRATHSAKRAPSENVGEE